MINVGMATSQEYAALTEREQALIPLLKNVGIKAEPVVWENKHTDFAKFDLIVIRSCWNYHMKVGAFRNWLEQLHQDGIPLANPYPVLLSNIDKSYLTKLRDDGVNVVPTEWVPKANSEEVLRILKKNRWSKAVLKPTISASAFHTYLISEDQLPPTLNGLENTEFMLQPFLSEITTAGEWSLIFFNKIFSHAILKKPGAGDFRVQQELGGTAMLTEADKKTIDQAREILHVYREPLLYARVDGIVRDGEFQLMELELIEPELFLLNETLLKNFARAIKEFVTT